MNTAQTPDESDVARNVLLSISELATQMRGYPDGETHENIGAIVDWCERGLRVLRSPTADRAPATPPLMTRVTEGYALRRKSDGYLWVMNSDGYARAADDLNLSQSPSIGSMRPDYWERVYVRRTVTIEWATPTEGPTP